MEVIPENISVQANTIALVGYEEGSAGQVHAWIEKATSCSVGCFVNIDAEPPEIDPEKERTNRDSRLFEYPTRDSFKGLPLLTSPRWPEVIKDFGIAKVLVTVSAQRTRLREIERAQGAGLELVSAIHPSALVLEEAVLHDNVILHSRAVIGYRAEIHDGCIVNTGAQLDHHNLLKKCVNIDPGVVTAGNVTIGDCAQLHTGAVVKNRIRIGADAVVGAGGVVIGDVADGTTVAGVPARLISET